MCVHDSDPNFHVCAYLGVQKILSMFAYFRWIIRVILSLFCAISISISVFRNRVFAEIQRHHFWTFRMVDDSSALKTVLLVGIVALSVSWESISTRTFDCLVTTVQHRRHHAGDTGNRRLASPSVIQQLLLERSMLQSPELSQIVCSSTASDVIRNYRSERINNCWRYLHLSIHSWPHSMQLLIR